MMLALKHMHIPAPHLKLYLLDLPNEILNGITDHLLADGGGHRRDLIPISLVCWKLRQLTHPVLFHTITLIAENGMPDKASATLLDSFASSGNNRMAKHVQHLNLFQTTTTNEDPLHIPHVIRDRLIQVFRKFQLLKTVCLDVQNIRLLMVLCAALENQPLDIQISGRSCLNAGEFVRQLFVDFVNHVVESSPLSRLRLSIPPQGVLFWPFRTSQKTRECVDALQWISAGNFTNIQRGLSIIQHMSNVQELHISQSEGARITDERVVTNALLQMNSLKRLSVFGEEFTGAVLRIVDQLKGLESLRLHSNYERLFHAHLHSEDREGLPYLILPRLHSLEIRYISRYLSIEHIIPSSLRSLRIEFRERTDRLRPFDFRWMIKQVPYLECLELNIGNLSNLWAPTAIAGVDVDVEVYQLLDALASFKNLRRLRFFPSYWKSQNGFLNFVQPVSDEQAVRIYQHLAHRIPNLQLLIICNTYADYMLKQEIYARDATEPMKWVVRSCGLKTILTTHQAGENYDLEQEWEGERRLWVKNIPHKYRRRHFDELHGWAVPAYEFPFDMQAP